MPWAPQRPRTAPALLLRALGGSHRTGALVLWPERCGLTRCRLVVHPPGCTDRDRLALRLWRERGVLALLAAVACLAALGPLGRPALGDAAAAAVALAVLGGIRRATRRLRPGLVVLDGWVDHVPGGTGSSGTMPLITACAAALDEVDARFAAGGCDAAAHELEWYRVWDAARSGVLP